MLTNKAQVERLRRLAAITANQRQPITLNPSEIANLCDDLLRLMSELETYPNDLPARLMVKELEEWNAASTSD